MPRERFLSTYLSYVVASVVMSVAADQVYADALVINKAATASTIAEIFVEKADVRIELEIGEADQAEIRNLLPDGLTEEASSEGEKFGRYFRDQFQIGTDSDESISGEIMEFSSGQRLARDEITGEPLAEQPPDREQVVRLKLRYPLDLQPEVLTIAPPIQPGTDYPVANIGFITYHNGLPVNDFRYLSAKVTLDLDWEDPWYSRFRHPNLKRQFDAPLSVFLYIEPFEVRKEIVLRPRDLQQWLDIGLEGQQIIPVAQQEPLKRKIAQYLSKRGDVLIDGQALEGRLDRIHFIHRSLRTTGVIEPAVDLDVNSATLGIIYVYPIDELPENVSMKWELFSPKIQSIPAIASDEAGGLPTTVTPEYPTLEWKNFLTNPSIPQLIKVAPPPPRSEWTIPVVSVGCGFLLLVMSAGLGRKLLKGESVSRIALLGGVSVFAVGVVTSPFARISMADPFAEPHVFSDREAQEVLSGLLHNIYRSFDHHDDSLIYDQLEKSLSGDLLSDVYLETRKSMEIKNQGGLRISVKEVVVKELEKIHEKSEEPTFRCRWRVSGSIGHWGHLHRRENEHVALITLGDRDGQWTITSLESLDEQSLDSSNPSDSNPGGGT